MKVIVSEEQDEKQNEATKRREEKEKEHGLGWRAVRNSRPVRETSETGSWNNDRTMC